MCNCKTTMRFRSNRHPRLVRLVMDTTSTNEPKYETVTGGLRPQRIDTALTGSRLDRYVSSHFRSLDRRNVPWLCRDLVHRMWPEYVRYRCELEQSVQAGSLLPFATHVVGNGIALVHVHTSVGLLMPATVGAAGKITSR